AATAGTLPGGAPELRATLELLQATDDAVAQVAEALLHLGAEGRHAEGLLLPGDRRTHFRGEVLCFLGQAFAQGVAGVPANLDVLADHRDRGVDLVLDRSLAVRVAEKRLLEEAIVLEELLQLPGVGLLHHRFGLAVPGPWSPAVVLLFRQHVLGDVFPAQPPRV